MPDEEIRPIDWEQVALIISKGGKTVAISSACPDVIAGTLLSRLKENDSAGELPADIDARMEAVLENFEWKLYWTGHAKQVFVETYK